MKKTHILLGVAAVGAVLIYSAGARGVARAAVGVAADLTTGVIHGVSDVVGLQTPEKTACEQAKLKGDTWEASFACEADDFMGYWWNK